MKEVLPLSDSNTWINRTIANVYYNGYSKVLIRFDDGSCAKISKEKDRYSDSETLETNIPLDVYDQRNLGIISNKEYHQFHKEKQEESIAANHERELIQYEKLKKKFGE